jgi:acyl-CoA reductase-like NAD-dependent aldehyde dehydrogenase
MDTQQSIPFANPATGEQFGQVVMAGPEDIKRAISELREAFNSWSNKPVKERARILGKFQQLVIDEIDEISAVITRDTGKTRQDALSEVFMTMDLLGTYRRKAPGWLKPQRVSSGLYIFKKCIIERKPYGVVLVIAPWNYPLYLALPPILSALLAGNTVILKPSEVTAASGILIEKLFQRIPELSPYIRVLHGDGSVGVEIIRSAPDYIFVTGSTETGKKILQAAAQHLTPVACELGGKDAVIVLDDADVPAAARWSVWGACYNTGQSCISIERAYVMEKVFDEFVNHAVAFTQELKQGYSQDPHTQNHLGPITDPRQLKVIQAHIDDARVKGARVLIGGNSTGMFFSPTVVVDVDHSMSLMREETFGPILPIMKVHDPSEAISLANENRYGLGASVWGKDLNRANAIAHQLQAGSILINDTIVQIAIPNLPFGGIKESGTGRIHGKEGLLSFTTSRAYAVSRAPFRWDVATIMRIPGNYAFGKSLMEVLFGVTMSQHLRPIIRWLKRSK